MIRSVLLILTLSLLLTSKVLASPNIFEYKNAIKAKEQEKAASEEMPGTDTPDSAALDSVEEVKAAIETLLEDKIPAKKYASKSSELPVSFSVLFRPAELTQLKEFMVFQSSFPEIGERKATEGSKENKKRAAPVFYLNSIVMYSNDNWVLWLNGYKIRQHQSKLAKIEITEVTKEKASFTWLAGDLETLSPGWRTKLEPIGYEALPLQYQGANASNAGQEALFYGSESGDILVDARNNIVQFTLRPNQSFVSQKMEIVEGKARNMPAAARTAAAKSDQGGPEVQSSNNGAEPKPAGSPPEEKRSGESAMPSKQEKN